jgi:poly-gamma-glutamate capsule biosynthesis protein CapA/YwtB (metallophosphatase superfamily)
LDYETEALLDMLDLLDKNQIKHSGAGRNLKEAMKPAIIPIKDSGSKSDNDESRSGNSSRDNSIRIGIVSLTDNEPGWEATKGSAGINYIPINLKKRESQEKEEEEVQKIDNNNNYHYYDRLKHSIQEAKEASDIVIVSSHVGPHFRENPSLIMLILLTG